MKIVFEKDPVSLREKAARGLSSLIPKKQPTLLLLAGGSAFSFLEYVDTAVLSETLTIGMTDERFSRDEAVNNFEQFTQTIFYAEAKQHGVHFLDSSVGEKESLENFGTRFEQNISDWIEQNTNGTIVATFGIGEDGHTAGIMPFPENPSRFDELFEKNPISVAYNAMEKNQYSLRTTVTLDFVRRRVQSAVVFASGEGKRTALEKVMHKEGTLAETPARIVREIKNLNLYTDIDVAS